MQIECWMRDQKQIDRVNRIPIKEEGDFQTIQIEGGTIVIVKGVPKIIYGGHFSSVELALMVKEMEREQREFSFEDPPANRMAKKKVVGTKHWNDGFHFHKDDHFIVSMKDEETQKSHDRIICPACYFGGHIQTDISDCHDCKNEFFEWMPDGRMKTIDQCGCCSMEHGRRN